MQGKGKMFIRNNNDSFLGLLFFLWVPSPLPVFLELEEVLDYSQCNPNNPGAGLFSYFCGVFYPPYTHFPSSL